MMEQMKFGPWIIEVDVGKTKEFYDKFHLISEDCNCSYCANYMLICDKFPREIKELFDSLGVDPCKEGKSLSSWKMRMAHIFIVHSII